MRRRVQVAVVLLLVLLAGGVGVAAVGRVRHAASRMKCSNNLKSIALGLHGYHSQFGHFPTGTVPNAGLPPDRRLGWPVEIYPSFMRGGVEILLDRGRAWDAEKHRPLYEMVRNREHGYDKELVGSLKGFHCPANPIQADPLVPSPTHYAGVAGVGRDAATLPLSDARAGVFGYDRKVSLGDIEDGQATTMALAEVVDGGPWIAGGRATVRGVEPGGVPYLGEGGQFASFHRGGNSCGWSRPIVTNVLLVDGSVRGLMSSVSPEVFEALATIAGGEEVGPLDP